MIRTARTAHVLGRLLVDDGLGIMVVEPATQTRPATVSHLQPEVLDAAAELLNKRRKDRKIEGAALGTGVKLRCQSIDGETWYALDEGCLIVAEKRLADMIRAEKVLLDLFAEVPGDDEALSPFIRKVRLVREEANRRAAVGA